LWLLSAADRLRFHDAVAVVLRSALNILGDRGRPALFEKHLRRTALLGSTAAAALMFGAGSAVACTVDVTGQTVASVNNSAAIDCINVNTSTVNGDINNTGSVNTITVTSSTVTGDINTGTVNPLLSHATAVSINGGTILGKVINSGTLAGTRVGLSVTNVSTFGGVDVVGKLGYTGIVGGPSFLIQNIGKVTGDIKFGGSGGTGGRGTTGFRIGNITKFTGNIINTGTVSTSTNGSSIFNIATWTGALINTGTFVTPLEGTGAVALDFSGLTQGIDIFNTGVIQSYLGTINTYTVGPGFLQILPSKVFQLGGTGAGNFDLGLGVAATLNVVSGTWTTTGTTAANWNILGGTMVLQGTISGNILNNGVFDISTHGGGGTTINSLSGANTGVVDLGSNKLTLANNSGTFAGVIADGGAGAGSGGSLALSGGSLTLTGVNTYTGATTVNGGTLEVDGSIAASSGVAVNSGGTLTGVGAASSAQINAGGIFAPGNGAPGSSMTVTSLALASGAFYAVNVNPTTASFANVTGAANLGGATVNAFFANGSYISKQYTILTAGSLGGTTFNSTVANSNLPVNFQDTLSYDPTHAYLNLALKFAGPSFGAGLNGNQQAVANTLTNFFNTTGGIPMVYGALTPSGLTQASGEAATGSQQTTFNAMNQFMGVMTDPFVAGRGDGPGAGGGGGGATGYADEANAYAASRNPNDALAAIYTKAPRVVPFEPRWSTWAAGFGGSQNTDGNAAVGSNNTTSTVAGSAVGADYRFSPFTIAGFALAGGGTSFSVNGSGSGHSDLFQVGGFVRHDVGPAYVLASLAYGWQDITTNRTVTAAGADQLRAEFNANAFSGRLEGGYRVVTPYFGGLGITPYAAGQFTTFDLPSYAEAALSGSSAFALSYNSQSVTDARSELGIRTDKSYAVQGGIFTLRGRFAWAHDYDPNRSVASTFQALPGASFVVNGAAQAADSALTTASAEMKWTNNWSIAATFDGEFSSVTSSYAGKGVVRYQW
jgi:uncharacterized protein with beta-barrel porin domain